MWDSQTMLRARGMPARVALDCLRHAANRSEYDFDWGSSSGSLPGVGGAEPLLFIAAVNALPSSFHDAPRRPVPLATRPSARSADTRGFRQRAARDSAQSSDPYSVPNTWLAPAACAVSSVLHILFSFTLLTISYFCLYALIVPKRWVNRLCRLADFSGLNGRSLDVDRDISL